MRHGEENNTQLQAYTIITRKKKIKNNLSVTVEMRHTPKSVELLNEKDKMICLWHQLGTLLSVVPCTDLSSK